jgi:hypothetical protein
MYAETCQNGYKKRETQYNRKGKEGSNKTVIREDVPSQEDVIFQAWVKAPLLPSKRPSPEVAAFLGCGELRIAGVWGGM